MGRGWYQVSSGSGSLAVGSASPNLPMGKIIAAGQFSAPGRPLGDGFAASPFCAGSGGRGGGSGGRLCRRQVIQLSAYPFVRLFVGQLSHYSPPPAGQHAAHKFWRDTKAALSLARTCSFGWPPSQNHFFEAQKRLEWLQCCRPTRPAAAHGTGFCPAPTGKPSVATVRQRRAQ